MAFDEIFNGLTGEQLEAVKHKEGPLLVLAGAGSGKTRVLTRRIAALMADGVPADNILAVTFTNKAAAEMKQRIDQIIGHNTRVWLSTFHSFCARLLRMESHHLGFSQTFGICDQDDVLSLIKEIMDGLNIDAANLRPAKVRTIIENKKNMMMSAEQFTEEAYTPVDKRIAQIYTAYQEYLKEMALMDFSDLLYYAVQLLENNEEVLSKYQQKFRYVLIDEYQDTNHLQYRLTQAITKAHRNICVVGDPDQSIYGWRGADFKNIINFTNDYPEAVVIGLDTNFRSTATILSAAYHVVKHNPPPHLKLKTPEDEPAGEEKIVVWNCNTAEDEAARIAQIIAERMDAGDNLSETAILYRINHQSKMLERALLMSQIPYVVFDGTAFYEYIEVKNVLAYLRVLVNPNDNVSFWRIINFPARGIGKEAQKSLENYRRTRGGSLLDALLDPKMPEHIKSAHSKKLSEFAEMLMPFVEMLAKPASVIYENLLETLQLKELIYQEYKAKVLRMIMKKYENHPQFSQDDIDNFMERLSDQIKGGTEDELNQTLGSLLSPAVGNKELASTIRRWWTAMNNLALLGTIIADYEDRNPESDLAGFLETASLASDIDKRLPQDNCVRLMTLHSAKGLEFQNVIMAGAEKGLFPSTLNFFDETSSDLIRMEEERRLFYVGITRAKRRLIITCSHSRMVFGRYTGGQSPFLEELISEIDRNNIIVNGASQLYQERQAQPHYSKPDYRHLKPRKVEEEETNTELPFKKGDKVRHRTFGIGTVAEISGSDEQCKVTVIFQRSGEKKLLLKFAPLEKI